MKLQVMLLAVALAGCGASTTDITDDFIMPEDLRDCRIYRLSKGGSHIYVVKCGDGSATTLRPGKNPVNTTILPK